MSNYESAHLSICASLSAKALRFFVGVRDYIGVNMSYEHVIRSQNSYNA